MRVALLVGLCLPLLATVPAFADDEIARGSVVRVEAKEIYVSLGAARGVSPGAALRIKRPINLKHPVTHAIVRRLAAGRLGEHHRGRRRDVARGRRRPRDGHQGR